MSRDPLTILLTIGMFAGPLLQGLGGFSDPRSYIFALPITLVLLGAPVANTGRDIGGFVLGFLAIGFGCLGLWWLGGRIDPSMSISEWLPVSITLVFVAAMAVRRFYLR